MNKKRRTILIALIAGAVLLGSCSVKQRIIGTWTDIEGNAWIFNNDGKLSYENGSADDIEVFLYVITDGKLSIKRTDDDDEYHFDNFSLQVYNISFSADGKTLILSDGTSFSWWDTAGPGWSDNQLTRSSKNNNKGNSNANLIDLLIKQYADESDFEIDRTEGKEMITKYGDGIVITKYLGTEQKVSIPPRIQNLPVTIIDYEAFSGCTSLTSVIIPNSVTLIGVNAFYGCTNLTRVTIPDSVTIIDYSAFSGCTSLTAINVASGNSAYTSENGVLYNKNKTNLIQYPAGKTGSSFTIPNSVTRIESYAFSGCTSLTNITIPNSITSIGEGAFWGCTSLSSVIIPNSINSIEPYAFAFCESLTSITFQGTIPSSRLDSDAFYEMGDLREKYLAGGIGTYTRHNGESKTWTKQ